VLAEIRRFKADNKLALSAEITLAKITTLEPELIDGVLEEINAAGKVKDVQVSKGEFKVEAVK